MMHTPFYALQSGDPEELSLSRVVGPAAWIAMEKLKDRLAGGPELDAAMALREGEADMREFVQSLRRNGGAIAQMMRNEPYNFEIKVTPENRLVSLAGLQYQIELGKVGNLGIRVNIFEGFPNTSRPHSHSRSFATVGLAGIYHNMNLVASVVPSQSSTIHEHFVEFRSLKASQAFEPLDRMMRLSVDEEFDHNPGDFYVFAKEDIHSVDAVHGRVVTVVFHDNCEARRAEDSRIFVPAAQMDLGFETSSFESANHHIWESKKRNQVISWFQEALSLNSVV